MATHYAIHRLDEVGSTQDEARARFGDQGPVVVIAGRQRQGRGRTGNVWVHAPRATAASVALRTDWPHEQFGLIPLLAGLAARDVVRDVFTTELSLKWPNDLMLRDQKVGGVLVEASRGIIVVGCGINVWWPNTPIGVGAVTGEDPGQSATFDLAERWCVRLLELVAMGPTAWDHDTYARVCSTLGNDVEWDPSGTGRAIGIAPDGGLIVATDHGNQTLRSGEVRTIRRTTLRATDPIDGGAESP